MQLENCPWKVYVDGNIYDLARRAGAVHLQWNNFNCYLVLQAGFYLVALWEGWTSLYIHSTCLGCCFSFNSRYVWEVLIDFLQENNWMKQTKNSFHIRASWYFTCSIVSYSINLAPDFGKGKDFASRIFIFWTIKKNHQKSKINKDQTKEGIKQ